MRSRRRDSFRKEQLLEPLSLVEGSLHPEVGGARQNTLCECEDAIHVEIVDLFAVSVHTQQREVLTISACQS
jgi:hypothetical protein